jgi:hypothetical protein
MGRRDHKTEIAFPPHRDRAQPVVAPIDCVEIIADRFDDVCIAASSQPPPVGAVRPAAVTVSRFADSAAAGHGAM